MACSIDKLSDLRISLLASGKTEAEVDNIIRIIIAKSKDSTLAEKIAKDKIEVVSADEKLFLQETYSLLKERITAITDDAKPLDKSFKELVSSLLTADQQTRLFDIMTKIKRSRGDFGTVGADYLSNLRKLQEIARQKNKPDQVAKLEERIGKETQRLNREQDRIKKSQSKRNQIRNEIETLEQTIAFISSILDGSISSVSTEVAEKLNNFNAQIADTKIAIQLASTIVDNLKKRLNTKKLSDKEKTKLTEQLDKAKEELKTLKQKLRTLEKERNQFVKEQIKAKVLTEKETLVESESLSSLKNKLSRRVDTLREQLAAETLKNFQNSSKRIAKSLEEKLTREQTTAKAIQNAYEQRLRILSIYVAEKQKTLPEGEEATVDLGFLQYLVGNNALEIFIHKNRKTRNPDGSFTINRSEFTFREAQNLIKESKKEAHAAMSEGFYSDDIAVATEQHLAYLEALALGREVIDVNEENVNNVPVIPDNPSFLNRSTPGVVPVKNKAKTAKELASWLEFTLRGLYTIRASKHNNGSISSVALDMVLHPNLYDVVSSIAFKDAISVKSEKRIYGGETKAGMLLGVKEMFRLTGIENPDALPEFKSSYHTVLPKEDNIVTLDIETTGTDGVISGIISIQLTVYEKGKKTTRVLVNRNGTIVDNKTPGLTGNIEPLTSDQIKNILSEVEHYQNNQYKLVTHNGNSFDLYNLHAFGADPKQLFRITTRSIDILENIRLDVGRKGVAGSGLKPLAQNNLPAFERLSDDGNIKFTNGFIQTKNPDGTWSNVEINEEKMNAMIAEANRTGDWSVFNAYAEHDTELTLELYFLLAESDGTNVKFTKDGTTNYHTISKPRSNIFLSSSDQNPGNRTFKDTLEKILTLNPELEAIASRLNYTEVMQLNLDQVIDILQGWLLETWASDPDNRETLNILTEGLEKESSVKNQLHALSLIKAKQFGAAVKPIAKNYFKKYGYVDKLNVITDPETGQMRLNPEIYTSNWTSMDAVEDPDKLFVRIEAMTDEQAAKIYETQVITYFLENLEETQQLKKVLELLVSRFNVRKQFENEQLNAYLLAVLPGVVSQYTGSKRLADFGNGNLDWHTAYDVGNALADVLTNKQEGLVVSDGFVLEGGNIDAVAELNGTMAAYQGRQKIFLIPTKSQVHFASPFGLSHESIVYDNFRLVTRINWALDQVWTDDQLKDIITWAETPQSLDKNQAISYFVKAAKPTVFPEIRIRSAFDNVANLDERKQLAYEFIYGMPRLLATFNHDCSYIGLKSPGRFITGEAPSYYATEWMSAGAPTAATVASGAIDQIAWLLTFDGLDSPEFQKELQKSIEAGVKLLTRNPNLLEDTNKSDYSFHGLHTMLAAVMMYGGKWQEITKLLVELGIGDRTVEGDFTITEETLKTKLDPRFKAIDLVVEELSKIKAGTSSEKTKYSLNESEVKLLEELAVFFDKNKAKGKEFLKGAVTPRFYQAGPSGIFNGLMKKIEDSNLELGTEHARVLTKVLLRENIGSHLALIDEAIGLNKKSTKELFIIFSNLSKTMSSTNFQRELAIMKDANWFGEVSTETRLNQMQMYFEKYVDLLAKKLVSRNLGTTEREQAIEAKKKELTEMYKDRIDRAAREFNGVNLSTINAEQRIKLQENVGRILSGGQRGYERHLTIWALNKRASTSFKLLTDQIDLHRRITGVHIDPDDYAGWTDRMIFHTFGAEAASGRNHMFGGYGWGPESSKLGQVRVEKGDEKNLLGIWDIDEAGVTEADYERAFGTQLMLDLLPYYEPPSSLGYDPTLESPENYFRIMEERSGFERNATRRAEMLDEVSEDTILNGLSVKDIKAKQAKVAGRPLERIRYRRLAGSTVNASNVANLDSTVDGIGATRPLLADLDFTQRGIYSLIGMQHQIAEEDTREQKLISKIEGLQQAKREGKAKDINEIIPLEARGYEKPTQKTSMPVIPLQTGSTISSMITGPLSEVAQLGIRTRNQLTIFAKTHGLEDLLEAKRWDLLFFISEGRRRALKPAMQTLEGAAKSDINSYITAKAKFFDGMFRMMGLTARQYNPDKIYSVIDIEAKASEIRFSKEFIEKLKRQNPEGLSYLNLLYELSHIFDRLRGIRIGLVQDPGVVVRGEPGLIKSSTRPLPLLNFGLEVANMYQVILTSDVMARVATEHIQATNPELFKSLPKDNNGYVIIEGLPLNNQELHQLIVKVTSEKAKELAKEWMQKNLVLGAPLVDITTLPKEMASEATGPIQVENVKIGTSHTITGVDNADTLWAFTEEMVVQLLYNLSNNPLFTSFELAYQTKKDIGAADTVTDRLVEAEERMLFTYLGQYSEEEHAAIVWLHDVDPGVTEGGDILTVDNYRIKDKKGNPTKLLDAPRYLITPFTLKFDDGLELPISVESAIYVADITKSIKRAETIGMDKEASQLISILRENLVEASVKPKISDNKLVSIGSDTLLRTVSVLYNLGTKAATLNRQQIMAYVQPGLTIESQKELMTAALEIVKIMEKVDNTNIEENQLTYYITSGLLDKRGEFDETLKDDPTFINSIIDSLGVKLTQKQQARAIRGIQHAVVDYLARPGKTVEVAATFSPHTDIAQFADPDKFIDAFGDTGRGIVDFLNGQVKMGNLSEQTRDMKLIMLGALAIQNPSFLADLQLEASELDGMTYAKASKINNKYTIGLNIKAMKVTPQNEMLLKFAEELVHIARIKYLKDNSSEFEAIKAVFRTANAKGMIREMLIAMNQGKPYAEIEKDVAYAMRNEEEFLSHFGAVILLQETVYSSSVLTELEAKYEAVYRLSSWWKRAFNRIKQFAKHALRSMSQLRENPYYKDNFNIAYQALQGIIGNGLKDKVDVGNLNMEFNARTTITPTTMQLTPENKAKLGDLSARLEQIERALKDKTSGVDVKALENEKNRIDSILSNPTVNPPSVMGIKESEVQRGLRQLKRDKHGRIILRRDIDFTLRALFAEGLNNYFKRRGGNVTNKDTIGGLIRIWEGDRKFIDNFILPLLEGFNQNGLTYNSKEALVVFIADLLDNTTINTESSYRSHPLTGAFVYQKEALKSYFGEVMQHAVLIQSQFQDPAVREQIMMDVIKKLHGLPITSTDPEMVKAVDLLYKPMAVWNTRLRSEILKSLIKPDIRFLDPIGVKLKTAQELTTEQKDKGFRAVTNMMRTKYLSQLQEKKLGGFISPYILYLGDLLPNPSIRVTEQPAVKESIEKFAKTPNAPATSAQEAVLKHLITVAIEKQNAQEQLTISGRSLGETRAAIVPNPGNLEVMFKEALSEFIYQTREFDQTFISAFTSLSTVEQQLIYDNYLLIVQDTSLSQLNSTRIREIQGNAGQNSESESFGFYQGNNKYIPQNQEKASTMDILAMEYLGKLGASAYLFDNRSPSLLYQDLFINTADFAPEDKEIARIMFEQDLTSIQHSLLKGLGYDAIQRIIVQDFLGIPGAYFTIGQIIDKAEGLNNQEIPGSRNKEITNLNEHVDHQRKHTIERSLERLRLANQEARETLGFRNSGSPLLDTMVKVGRPAAMWAFGTNIPIATAMVEGTMGAIGSLIRGYNPVSYLWDAVVQNTVMSAQTLGDIVTLEEGKVKFWNISPNVLHGVAENSLWLMEEMFSPMLPGKLVGSTFTNDAIQQMDGWQRFNIVFGRLQSTTMKALRVASESQARRRIASEIRSGNLYRLRDSVQKILKTTDNPSNSTLKAVIRDAGVKIDQEILLIYIRSGLFEPNVIESLEYVMSVAPSTRGDITLIGMRNQEYELGPTKAISFGSGVVSANSLYQARGALIKLMKRHADLFMTTPHPLDGTANSTAMNIIMTFYKSYPTLFVSQFLMRRGATTPGMRFAFEMVLYAIMDVAYNIFLALRSGYYRWEKLKKALSDRDINWAEVLKLTLRYPLFSNNLVGLGLNLAGNAVTSYAQHNNIFTSVGEAALNQTVKNFVAAGKSWGLYAMGEVGPTNPLWNTYKVMQPVMGGITGALVKMLIQQAYGDLNTSGRRQGSRSPTSFVMDKIDSISPQSIRERAIRNLFQNSEYRPKTTQSSLQRELFTPDRYNKIVEQLRTSTKPQVQKAPSQETEYYRVDTNPETKANPATSPLKPPKGLLG